MTTVMFLKFIEVQEHLNMSVPKADMMNLPISSEKSDEK